MNFEEKLKTDIYNETQRKIAAWSSMEKNAELTEEQTKQLYNMLGGTAIGGLLGAGLGGGLGYLFGSPEETGNNGQPIPWYRNINGKDLRTMSGALAGGALGSELGATASLLL